MTPWAHGLALAPSWALAEWMVPGHVPAVVVKVLGFLGPPVPVTASCEAPGVLGHTQHGQPDTPTEHGGSDLRQLLPPSQGLDVAAPEPLSWVCRCGLPSVASQACALPIRTRVGVDKGHPTTDMMLTLLPL